MMLITDAIRKSIYSKKPVEIDHTVDQIVNILKIMKLHHKIQKVNDSHEISGSQWKLITYN